MKISVIDCGRWGSLIAWYLDINKHEVKLYGRESSKNMGIESIQVIRRNYDYSNL